MLPIVLDLNRYDIVLVGTGTAAARRVGMLAEAGAERLRIYSPGPSAELRRAARDRLIERLPKARELSAARLVFISEREADFVDGIAARARAAGALVHIEDDPARSDFHLPAVLRRGELAIAISTGGASPALAVRLKRALAELFGPEWRGRTEEIAALRRRWRQAGADAETLKQRTEALIARRRWLPKSVSRNNNP